MMTTNEIIDTIAKKIIAHYTSDAYSLELITKFSFEETLITIGIAEKIIYPCMPNATKEDFITIRRAVREICALRAAGIADWLARLSANAPWPITDADLSWPAGTLALVAEEAILTGIAPEDTEAVCRIAERVQDRPVDHPKQYRCPECNTQLGEPMINPPQATQGWCVCGWRGTVFSAPLKPCLASSALENNSLTQSIDG